MISLEVENFPDKQWNDRLNKSNYATIYQTKEFGQHLENIGYKPYFIKFIDESGVIIGQIMFYNTNRFEKNTISSKILRLLPLKKSIDKWVYGPIIFQNDRSIEIFKTYANFLNSRHTILSGSIHPFAFTHSNELSQFFNILPWGTFLINLHKNKEELFSCFDKSSAQKTIKRSINRGIVVEEITKKNLEEYVNLKIKSESISSNELENMEDRWNLLKPLGYSGFLAKKDDIVVGGLMFSFFNKYIIEGGLFRTPEDNSMKYYSQDLIKWKIIEWGCQHKMNYYDLAGFNPNPISEKEKGIKRYKSKWGGKAYDYLRIS